MTQELQLEAKQDHLVQIASTRDPIKAIAEFIWNAVDADATKISVEFPQTALGEATQAIVISDNGTGIDEVQARSAFAGLGDSWKRTVPKTRGRKRAMHGKEGRGRLRFYSLADTARWRSTYAVGNELKEIEIEIAAAALGRSRLSEPRNSKQPGTGTVVELTSLKPSLEWLRSDLARQEFTAIFAPYLLQYPDVEVRYAGKAIDTNESIERHADLATQGQHNHISSAFQRLGWQNLGGSSYRYPKLGTVDHPVEDWFNHVIPALMLFRAYVVQHGVDIRFTLDVQSSSGYDPSTNFGHAPVEAAGMEFYPPTTQQFGAQKLRDWMDGVDYPY